jgi:class 3 adenylate cyclase
MTNKLLDDNTVEATIAIVLTDIIGSTKFVQKNGSHAAAKWFGAHDKAVMNFIARHNGQLVDASDGHLMYFATVQDAIAFAFTYKKFLKKKKFPFKSRVGIHWDTMLIIKSDEHMVRAGGKRINLEGIGKNIAARTMSICGEDQVLLSKKAYAQFQSRTKKSRYIPKDAKVALAGLYLFKGVSKPEQIYVLGTEEAHLQPPKSGEKVKRLGGKKKIKVRLRNKKLKEILWWGLKKLALISTFYIIFSSWNFLSNSDAKKLWNIDYFFLKPFEWLNYLFILIKKIDVF